MAAHKSKSLLYLSAAFIIILLLIVFSDFRLTGAMIDRNYENSILLTVNDTVPIVRQNVQIDQLTKNCDEAVYIDANGLPIDFWIENSKFDNEEYCTETEVLFNNVIYNSKGSGEETLNYIIYYNINRKCGNSVRDPGENILNCPTDCIRTFKSSFVTIVLLAILFLIIGWGVISHRRKEKKYPKMKSLKIPKPKKKRLPKKMKTPRVPKPLKKHKAKLK
jgi:hypothetical protein